MTLTVQPFGPDRAPAFATTVVEASPVGVRPEGGTQYPQGHLLGTATAVVYGRHTNDPGELERIAATVLAMARAMREDGVAG